MKAWPLSETEAANTPIWQLVILPAEPVYCRPTPHEALPCFKKLVSSTTSTAPSSARCSMTYSRTVSRSASASQRPRPRIACCRKGSGSPAASARIHPVLRRSAPSSPSRNRPADAATRSCVNSGRIRSFTSRSDAAQSSSVSSIDAPLIHALPITREKVRAPHQNCNCSARWPGKQPPKSSDCTTVQDGLAQPARQEAIPAKETKEALSRQRFALSKGSQDGLPDLTAQWKARIGSWVRSGGRFWLPQWGPKPNEAGCFVPASVLPGT